jgi:hyperosmotically inducible periplasmic protein
MKIKFALGAVFGALGVWFLDPRSGARRRHVARDRALAFARQTARRAGRLRGAAAFRLYALVRKATHLREERKEYDDATLKAKVETELFRQEHEVKGSVDVNAQDGVIQLRGELPSETLIDVLVERTRKINGVREVENLLHTPKAPAPMHQ